MAAAGLVEVVRAVARGPGERTASPWCARPGASRPPRYEGWGSACSTTRPWRRGRRRMGSAWARVLIADWDVHHGNGTQDVFYDSPRVFFFSTHQYPRCPGTGGRWDETGAGAGRGYTANVPLPARGWGMPASGESSPEVLEPLAKRFPARADPGLGRLRRALE